VGRPAEGETFASLTFPPRKLCRKKIMRLKGKPPDESVLHTTPLLRLAAQRDVPIPSLGKLGDGTTFGGAHLNPEEWQTSGRWWTLTVLEVSTLAKKLGEIRAGTPKVFLHPKHGRGL
jgi:hypothetical protein